MQGVFNLYNKKVGYKKTKGVATLSTYEFSRKADPFAFWRSVRDGMTIYDGKYVRLHVDGVLMMSDTEFECNSNRTFCDRANGRVLIAGLGIGLVLHNLTGTLNLHNDITEIVVVELYKDVIALVGPYFKHPKIKIVHADIREWSTDELFDTIYFDIWPTIDTGNIPEINALHKRFRKNLNKANPDHFIGSWMHDYLRRERTRTRRGSWH